MDFRNFVNQALVKGENLKDEITEEILKSPVFKEFARSDLFERAVSTVVKTKDDVARSIRQNVKTVLKLMDIPSRNDVNSLERKLAHIAKELDRVGRRTITVKSLKKIKRRKASKVKKPASRRKATRKKKRR